MTSRAVDGMAAVASAATSIRLYGESHPSGRLHADRAAALFNDGLRPGAALRIILMPDGLAVDNKPVPRTRELASQFKALREAGIDCVLIARGVRGDEILAVARAMLSKARPVKAAHMDFASLRATDADSDVLTNACAIAGARANRQRLERTWEQIQRGEGADDKLWSAIGDITASASTSAGSLISLAALKHHDQYTFVHTINVGILSTALARAAGASGDLLADITASALLHDVGKRLVPVGILNKSGKLDDRELEIVRRHPANGAELLIGAPGVPELAPVVAYEHHMDLDGGGYPKRKRRWRINFASQIVHIADVFDALRTDRPYRKALSLAQAIEIMELSAGRAFDADLFETFRTRVAERITVKDPPDKDRADEDQTGLKRAA